MRRKAIKWWQKELGIETKAEVEGKVRTIVSKYLDNQPVAKDDQAWLIKVFEHHYQYTAKIGCGLEHLEVRTNSSWNGPSRGFWIKRKDGTSIDISWVIALKPGGRPDPKEDASKAARYEIYEQIHHHHKNGECNVCPICDVPMQRKFNLHVDHEIPFKKLFDDFLEEQLLCYEDVEIDDLGLDSRFADRELAQAWKQYHQDKAKLRLTHSQCNLARKAA
jgi:hypothetical protein